MFAAIVIYYSYPLAISSSHVWTASLYQKVQWCFSKAWLKQKQNALNPWRAVKPAYTYACLSIAVSKKSALCLIVQCISPKPETP